MTLNNYCEILIVGQIRLGSVLTVATGVSIAQFSFVIYLQFTCILRAEKGISM